MTANDLLVGLVSAHGLGAVKVRVDTRINLVEHVAVVGSCRGVGVSAANSSSMVRSSQARAGVVGAMATCQARRSV